ncbi:DUF6160 family protein [Marinobacteraceae bacterium S3BR75-40.1]
MKTLKHELLALAVGASVCGAQAELKPMDDTAMGKVTGQAGVTIELETKFSIDEFLYTDQGSLAIEDITVGGAKRTDMFPAIQANLGGISIPGNATDKLDNMKMDIDILDDGDALIQIFPMSISPVDFRIATGKWELRPSDTAAGDRTVLMDNLKIDGVFNQFRAQIDTATDTLNIQTLFGIDDLDVDIPFLAMGIRDMRMMSDSYFENSESGGLNILDATTSLNMDIYKGPNAAGDASLAVDINEFRADVAIGGILVGGTSVGSVALDNLAVQDTQMRIYGH